MTCHEVDSCVPTIQVRKRGTIGNSVLPSLSQREHHHPGMVVFASCLPRWTRWLVPSAWLLCVSSGSCWLCAGSEEGAALPAWKELQPWFPRVVLEILLPARTWCKLLLRPGIYSFFFFFNLNVPVMCCGLCALTCISLKISKIGHCSLVYWSPIHPFTKGYAKCLALFFFWVNFFSLICMSSFYITWL